MAYKLWTTNELLTASDVNTYLSRQVIVICTSGTRPGSPIEGQHCYETDTNAIAKYNGSGWEYVSSSRTLYTPSLTGSTTDPTLGTGSVRFGWYTFAPGPSVHFNFFIKFGSSGVSAGSGNYNVSLPVASASPYASGHCAVGSVQYADNSTGAFQPGSLFVPNGSSTAGLVGAAPVTNSSPWTWAANDYLSGSVTYPI